MTLIHGADCQIISSSVVCVELLPINLQDEKTVKSILEKGKTLLPQSRCRKNNRGLIKSYRSRDLS